MLMVYAFRFCLTTLLLSIMLVGCADLDNQQQGMDNNPNDDGNRNGVTNNNDTDPNNPNTLGNDDNLGQDNLNNGNGGYNTQDDGTVQDDNGGRTRMEIADEAADRVTQLEEVSQANVLTTDNNAYVAAVLEDDQEGELAEDMKNKIAQKVKAVDPDIDNVNVSTNPDFVDRVREYADAVDRGEPVEGLFDQLNEGIQRLFPNAE
jgi:spore cortex protein